MSLAKRPPIRKKQLFQPFSSDVVVKLAQLQRKKSFESDGRERRGGRYGCRRRRVRAHRTAVCVHFSRGTRLILLVFFFRRKDSGRTHFTGWHCDSLPCHSFFYSSPVHSMYSRHQYTACFDRNPNGPTTNFFVPCETPPS